MSDTYQPLTTSERSFTLAPRSLGRQEKIDRLEYRLRTTPPERRQEIAEQWGLPTENTREAEERLRAVRAALQDEEDESVRDKLQERLKGLQQRVEAAAGLEPISYKKWVTETAFVLFEQLASVEDEELDVEVVRRAHEDFTLRANGTSREEVESQLSALSQSAGSLLQGTTGNGQTSTQRSPR